MERGEHLDPKLTQQLLKLDRRYDEKHYASCLRSMDSLTSWRTFVDTIDSNSYHFSSLPIPEKDRKLDRLRSYIPHLIASDGDDVKICAYKF